MDHKTTPPPSHKWVTTEDGSQTLFSENFQEACHSSSGARAETLLHYVRGCQVEEKLKKNALSVLEVGFGLGIGFLVTYETLSPLKRPWSFLSLELDRDLLEWFRIQNLDHPFLKNLKWRENLLEAEDNFCSLKILCGNAREVLPLYLKQHSPKWNAIYQDAFSPRRNPILWTKEWFTLLKDHSSDDVILSTYSASSSIRKSLLEVGWSLHEGEKFGPKRASTRALLQGTSAPEILQRLERSPIPALSDDNVEAFLQK